MTGPLLTTAPGLVNGTVNDVLLTALALAVLGRRDADGEDGADEEGAVLVDVEGHGREDVADGTDLSRTVGWFTTVFPVRLALGRPDLDEARAGGPAVGAALRLVKEELRAVPDKGIGFGLLRHLNSRTGPDLAARGIPQIGFNYLGRFPMGGDAPGTPRPGTPSPWTTPTKACRWPTPWRSTRPPTRVRTASPSAPPGPGRATPSPVRGSTTSRGSGSPCCAPSSPTPPAPTPAG
ncbi:hypothetical protein ACU4GG_39760 [Streptomyces nojiriensis]